MIVSHAHKFIFLKTQKCAGTSIELALSEICGPDDIITRVPAADEKMRKGRGPQNEDIPVQFRPFDWRLRSALRLRTSQAGTRYFNHMSAKAIRAAMDPVLFNAYRKLTVVRNPWDREVSLYYWTYRDRSHRPSFDQFVRRWKYRPERKNFDLYSIDGRIVADVVLRYETLSQDFSAFIDTLDVAQRPELPRAKTQQRKKDTADYRSLYSSDTETIVRNRYAREIEAFGYQF